GVILHHYVVTESRVCDARARANHTSFADHSLSLDRDVWMDDRVAPNLSFRTDVRVRRIDERYAALDHQPPNCRATNEVLKLSKLGACVDPGNFARVVVEINTYLAAARQDDFSNVRQVILTLIILRLDFAQRVEQIFRFETVDAGVDLAHPAFLFSRIALLHDLLEGVTFVANDAAVAGRIFETNAENRTGRACVVVVLDQLLQRLNTDHRHVA